MNILGMVFGLFLIFACCFSLSFRKEMLSSRVELTYASRQKANRKLLKAYEGTRFDALRSAPKEAVTTVNAPRSPSESVPKKRPNRECARINLWPLLLDGKETHPLLYECAANVLRSLYAETLFEGEKRLEYQLLNALLRAAELKRKNLNASSILLEKLNMPDIQVKPLYTLQWIYYCMLRGTQKQVINGYPSLLDYFVLDDSDTKICLPHASAELLKALFGLKASEELYQELHKEHFDKDRVRQICISASQTFLSDEELFSLATCSKNSKRKMVVAESGDVSLRKQIFIPTQTLSL